MRRLTPFGFGPLEMAFDTINTILQVAESTGNVAGNRRSSILLDLGEGYHFESGGQHRFGRETNGLASDSNRSGDGIS
jgi:hypothetical protein